MRIVLALLFGLTIGCGGSGDGGSALPTTVPESSSLPLCTPPSLLALDYACAGKHTLDGRECAGCTYYTGCAFSNPELGYCVDHSYGCNDPRCQ